MRFSLKLSLTCTVFISESLRTLAGGRAVVLAEDLVVGPEGAHEVQQLPLVGLVHLVDASVVRRLRLSQMRRNILSSSSTVGGLAHGSSLKSL